MKGNCDYCGAETVTVETALQYQVKTMTMVCKICRGLGDYADNPRPINQRDLSRAVRLILEALGKKP